MTLPSLPAGAVPLQILSLRGASDPAGPAAATSVPSLISELRSQLGRDLACPGRCWGDAKVDTPHLLVAVRLGTTACVHIDRASALRDGAAQLRIELDAEYVCTGAGGGGAVARASLTLLGAPLAAIPLHSATHVVVEVTYDAAAGPQPVGSADVELP